MRRISHEFEYTMPKISDWIEKYGWTVLWNEDRDQKYGTFHSNGNNNPDILIRKNGYNVLIETKTGNGHKDILDAVDQVLRYAGEYHTGGTEYTDSKDGIPLRINAFVIATDHSPDGFLYNEERRHKFMDNTYLGENLNLTEKPISHTAVRLLWRQWEKGLAIQHYEENADPLNRKPYVGALLAKIRHDTQDTTEPHLFLNSNKFVPIGYEDIYAFN